MRAIFYVFSATGNTKRVCALLADEWKKLGHEADVVAIRADSEYPDPREYDLMVVGFPVHAFNAPAAVLKFLKKLPAGDRNQPKPAYLVRTSGEPLRLNDASAITPRRILKKRGFLVRGEYRYVMPYNIIFRHSDKMAARMWRAAQIGIPKAAEEIAAGGGKREGVNIFKRMVAFALRIEHTAMPFIGRHFKPKKKKCIGCGACAKLCPQGNITMVNGKPKFGKHCVGCMACSFGCPEDALKISVLNAWRVNGKYDFAAEPAGDKEVCRYCRRSYLRYFRRAESAGRTGNTKTE